MHAGGAAAGGGGGGGGGRGGNAGGAPTQPTFAQRQLQRQRQDERALQRKTNAERKAQELQAEVTRLQRELAARDNGAMGNGEDDELDDMDVSDGNYDTWTEEERQRQVEVIKGGLPYLEQRFGSESEEVANAKAEVEALQRASREAKPYRTHRGQLERRKARLEAQQERDGEEKEKLEGEIEEANERLGKLQATMEERTIQIDKVDSELKELLRRALAEDGDAPAPTATTPAAPAPRAEAWSSVEATLSELASNTKTPPEQAQQLASFFGLFRQVATNVLASPGGAALATPPSCGPRWAQASARRAAGAAAADASGSTQTNCNTKKR